MEEYVELKTVNVNTETGLTFDEQLIMNALLKSFRIYSQLPKEHPSDLEEFVLSLHRLQDLLAVRVVRRNFPMGWYTCQQQRTCKDEKEMFSNATGTIDPLIGTMTKSQLSEFIIKTVRDSINRNTIF